jgi:hypothetical protein
MMLLILAAAFAPNPSASQIERWRGTIDRTAAHVGVPAPWIANVMRVESNGRAVVDGRGIRSVKGAIGLMQIMPATWKMLRAAQHLGSDPDNPNDNIMAGATYLRELYERFGYPAVFAAYHAGPTRYQAFLSGRVGLPSATMAYARLVLAGLEDGSTRVAERDARMDRGLSTTPRLALFVDLSDPVKASTIEDGGAQKSRSKGPNCERMSGLWAVSPSCSDMLPARAP